MPAFFLVSGLLASLLLQRRGATSFWLQRRRRLLYPLIAGTITIVPLTYLVEGISVTDPSDLFVSGFAHLWFIEYLLIFSCILVLTNWVSSKFNFKLNRKGAPLGVFLVNPISVAALITITYFIPQWFDGEAGALSPSSSLLPPAGLFLFYFVFFAFGSIVQCCFESTLKWLKRFAFGYLAIGLASFFVYSQSIFNSQFKELEYLSYTISTWMLTLGIIGMCLHFASKENRVVTYLSDASYWIYLIHFPIMVLLIQWFATLELTVGWSFVISIPVVFAISVLLYELLVRDKFLGKLLAGRL
jgi:peptidoglycan/LPS O-acetylase OafA/YrhL